MTTTIFDSPLGLVRISGDAQGVSVISCTDIPPYEEFFKLPFPDELDEPVRQATGQLHEYFDGTRQTFDFLMNPLGTAFQQTVWQALLKVPFGSTMSYLELSRQMGNEKAIRAVAAANGRNPLWIVVPLPPHHRFRWWVNGLRRWTMAQTMAAGTRGGNGPVGAVIAVLKELALRNYCSVSN